MNAQMRSVLSPIISTVVLLALVSAAMADWRDHSELPDWARRGYVQWGHGANIDGRIRWGGGGGYGTDTDNVRLILSTGRNIQQTIAYLDEEAEAVAREGGLRRQPYICSQTVWWRREYEQTPALTEAVRLGLDGKPIIIYNNPERHCGCYNRPFWLEYMKQRVKNTIEGSGGHVESIFFDNPLPYDCYCPECRDGFARFSADHFGVELDLAESTQHPDYRMAKTLFQLNSTLEFFEQVKAYIDTFDTTITISPNIGVSSPSSAWLTMRGMTEMVFCERGHAFPPFVGSVIDYKLGLACSHGLAAGQLLGLPPLQARTRALALLEGHEGGILESFMYPEEHKLATAEALACDGAYIASYALREQKISLGDAPHHVAVREALEQYAEFTQEHLSLYDLAQPGSSVAVLNSIWSQLPQGWSGQRPFRETCAALGRAMVPYEVIIEEDLRPELLAPYRLLILPQVRSLSHEDVQVLLDWVRGGGALITAGELALADRLNRAYPEEELSELARLPVGVPQEVGDGVVWRLDSAPAEIPAEDLAGMLEGLAGTLDCRVTTESPRVFANVLRSSDGSARSIHLVNSDFAYELPASTDVRDDDGQPEARTPFVSTTSRARKVVLVPDTGAIAEPVVRFFGNSLGSATDAFSMVISLNGQEIATFRGTNLTAARWHQVPIPAGLLAERNEIIFRATGAPNSHPDWFQLQIDTNATTGRSWWSEDEGATWSAEDLSPDGGLQTGEYLVRIGPAADEAAVAKPEDFIGRLQVRPARELEVRLRMDGPAPVARLLSPDAPEQAIESEVAGGAAIYRVPEVFIYSVLVVPEG